MIIGVWDLRFFWNLEFGIWKFHCYAVADFLEDYQVAARRTSPKPQGGGGLIGLRCKSGNGLSREILIN
ncbi:MAG: hypothetical protein COX31_00720 [Candidatus Moranbacteria bacterium CG23_combo_of_CG06-09_8_20_14_all_40_16]|nr:MAG: hypothetical protein COX31_00720 [Candidatus Moranbacteria bacterium CG23_combo_of_CG06-09_8_20_14_all_40_16]